MWMALGRPRSPHYGLVAAFLTTLTCSCYSTFFYSCKTNSKCKPDLSRCCYAQGSDLVNQCRCFVNRHSKACINADCSQVEDSSLINHNFGRFQEKGLWNGAFRGLHADALVLGVRVKVTIATQAIWSRVNVRKYGRLLAYMA